MGIMRTKKLIPFSRTVNAACLPQFTTPKMTAGKNLKISGWGKESKILGSYQDALILKTATIQSYRNQDCCKYTNNAYDCNTNNVVIDDSVLCAGSTNQKIGVFL